MTRTVEIKVFPAVVGGAVALLLASTGTAVAGKLITGADVKDGSLTGRDVKNASIRAVDLSTDVRDPLQRIGHFKRYVRKSAPIAEGETGYVSFTCPAANQVRAISAGGEWQDDDGFDPVQVAPDEGTDNAWHVKGYNGDGAPDRLVLSVTCGRVAYSSSDQ